MATTPIVDKSTGPSYVPHLVPIVRVVAKDAGVIPGERAEVCAAPFQPRGWNDGTRADAAQVSELFVLADSNAILAALAPGRRREATVASAQFQQTVSRYLVAALGTGVTLEVTILSEGQGGLRAGTVVLERDSSAVTEQYAFPFVAADPAKTQWSVLSPPARPLVSRGIHPMAGGLQFGQQIVGAAMAVTPFIPPPIGPAFTGVLSLINLILGVAGSMPGSGPTPLDAAVTSIESFISETTLSGYAGAIKGPANEYANMAKAQTADIASLTSIDGGIAAMQKKLDDTWTPAVVTANASLYQLLKLCDTTNFAATLSLLVSGITTELLMYHGQVAIGLVDASIQYRHQDIAGYAKATSEWTTIAGTASNDIGTTHTGVWSDQDISDAMNSSTAYFPQIEAWMERVKRDRLAKVADVQRYAFASYGGGTTIPSGYSEKGWTYQDSGASGDGGYEANEVADTKPPSVCDDPVEHKDTATANRAAYLATLAQKIDDGFAPHRTIMATWTTYVSDLLALLPPGIPSPPTASAAPGGPATPSGEWPSGGEVRYSLMAKSTKGPAPASDWSAPLTIGPTVGADVGGIAPVSGADALVVLRQFRNGPTAAWSAAEQVVALTAPFPSSYRDMNAGGDPW